MADAEAVKKSPVKPATATGGWSATGLRRLASKNGQFSKTALIHSVVWLCAIPLWVALTLFAGFDLDLFGLLKGRVPQFDIAGTSAMLMLASGAYLTNTALKNQAARTGPG